MIFRSKPYLNFIRSMPCVMCNRPGSHAHHEALHKAGIGIKAPDSHTLPLCPECHALRHRLGAKTFWGNRDVRMLIIESLTQYIAK